jgi:hypothetical protein
MRKLTVLFALIVGLGPWGCQFTGGAGSWNGATVASYESSSHHRMNQVEDDYRANRITRRDYETRKGQIEIGAIHY